MIITRSLNKKFGKITAVKDLDLHVKEGKIHGLVGPEASGKSTVLLILSTLLRPDSGDFFINGMPFEKGSHIRKMIGFVPKTPQLPLEYTAFDMVSFTGSLYGLFDTKKITNALKQMGLDAVADQKIYRFSENMKKNLAFANAFVHDPKILLLDEPMAGLDPFSQRRLREILLSSNKTILMTGQDLNTIDGLCTSVSILRNGSVIVEDELSSLRQRIGKGAIEIKLQNTGYIKNLLFELEKISAKVMVSGEYIYVNFNNDSEIPAIIRLSAGAANVMEAKPVKLSIDDIFTRFQVDTK